MQSMKDPNADSDLYIIPNPYGPGTTVIRRPHPPPTTTALDEDFDAITVDCTTVLGPKVEQEESGSASRGADLVVRRETYHADSKEYGEFGWPIGEAESVLSDLNLSGIGRLRSGSLKSRDDGGGSRRDSKFSDGGKYVGEGSKSSKRDGGSGTRGRGGDSSRIGTIHELVDHGTGGTVKTWRVSVAKSREQGAQIDYEDSYGDDTATEMGGPAPQARTRRTLDEDHKQRKAEGRSGKPQGKNVQPSVGDEQPIAIGRKKSEQPRSISNPAYTRSERIYSAADLDVPQPSSEYSPSGCVQDDTLGSPQNVAKSSNLKHNQNNQSRSYIGSAKETSSSALDNILSSFQPSLLHITPVLASLGIRHEEHLRAVGRLSDETRDREVKEVALKEGVTVVEWAMLVDRIRSL